MAKIRSRRWIMTIPVIEKKQSEIPQTEALKFVKDLKVGWNLGNTFDAENGYICDGTQDPKEMNIESAWCGVKTTKEMIDRIRDAGFKTIRIPVSWHNHVYGDGFTISAQWLDRVQEVVDYARQDNLYVILNIHHDMEQKYCYPTKECLDTSLRYMTCIWEQLSERFQDYDEHLIFESINEPRLKDTEHEWWYDGNDTGCKEALDCIHKWNQKFVDVVRASRGQNVSRYLMVPSYDASGDNALIDDFCLPQDVEGNDNKIIVSVHAYIPYHYALQAENEADSVSRFSAGQETSTHDIDALMSGLYEKYVQKGIPVVVGEFGSRAKNGNEKSRVEYAAYYIAEARSKGISCCWWDNNAFQGEGELFGLLDREKNSWQHPEIVEALMKYAE